MQPPSDSDDSPRLPPARKAKARVGTFLIVFASVLVVQVIFFNWGPMAKIRKARAAQRQMFDGFSSEDHTQIAQACLDMYFEARPDGESGPPIDRGSWPLAPRVDRENWPNVIVQMKAASVTTTNGRVHVWVSSLDAGFNLVRQAGGVQWVLTKYDNGTNSSPLATVSDSRATATGVRGSPGEVEPMESAGQ